MNFVSTVKELETYYDLLEIKKDSSLEEIQFKLNLEIYSLLNEQNFLPNLDLVYIQYLKAFAVFSSEKTKKEYDEKIDNYFLLFDSKIRTPEYNNLTYLTSKQFLSQEDSNFREYKLFKKQIGQSLWLLKSTAFFIFAFLFYSVGFYFYYIFFKDTSKSFAEMNREFSKEWITVHYFTIFFLGLIILRFIIQPIFLKSKKKFNKL